MVCACPVSGRTRIPDCTCNSFPQVSPLFQIRWKRLVVDEGHVHGAKNTRLGEVANLLSVERRWLVTGTPTTDLLGLSFGSQSFEADNDQLDLQYPSDDGEDLRLSEEDPASNASRDDLGLRHLDENQCKPRIWTSSDRSNLRRLDNMISKFLQVPRFAAAHDLFNSQVVNPLFKKGGPAFGSIQVLTQVMASVMVRHRYVD